MRRGGYPGAAKMPHILRAAPGDIRQRLWTLYWLTRGLCDMKQSCRKIVALGTRRGDSTRAILSACEDMANETALWSYDIEDVGHHVREVTAAIGIPFPEALWFFHQGSSIDAGKNWLGKVDMVFVDTDHTFETTRAEIAAWSPFVRPGGCLVFHDYWLSEAPRDGVKPAVDQFSDARAKEWILETHDAAGDGDTGLAILWRSIS